MTKKYFVSTTPPPNFSPVVEAVGCYCEFEDKLLFLRRADGRPEPKTWCLPGGKLEDAEDSFDGAVRELHEETGILIDRTQIEKIAKLYIRLPHIDYVFHIFRTRLFHLPQLKLALDEHEEARWLTPNQILELPVIPGGLEALEFYEAFVSGKDS